MDSCPQTSDLSVDTSETLASNLTPAQRKARLLAQRQALAEKHRLKSSKMTGGVIRNENVIKVLRSPSSKILSPWLNHSPLQSPKSFTEIQIDQTLCVQPQSSPKPYNKGSSMSDDLMSPTSKTGEARITDLNTVEKPQMERKLSADSINPRASISEIAKEQIVSPGLSTTYDPDTNKHRRSNNANSVHFKGIDLSNLIKFNQISCPLNMVMQCKIVRNKRGIVNKMYPIYECYYETEPLNTNNTNGNGISITDKLIMCAKKRSKNKTSNYSISTSIEYIDDHTHVTYLGKVRSNFVGTEFIVYDKGLNPERLTEAERAHPIKSENIRKEIAGVCYESNILGHRGPRKMTALLPAMKKGPRGEQQSHVFRPLRPEDSLVALWSKDSAAEKNLLALTNKTPKWHETVGAYVLNFNGRVTQASVKNFQLINEADPESVLLQFGRISKDTFTMDFMYPLTPLQAFAICLTSFDYKLACE